MATLIAIVSALPPDTLRRLSRIRIEHAPGSAQVVMHIAGMAKANALGMHPLPGGGIDVRQISRGPVCAGNADGLAARNPPVQLMQWDAHADIQCTIDVADLDAQIDDLHASRIVGRLKVVPQRRHTLLITSAGSAAERGAWVRCIDHDGATRPVYDETAEAPQYVSIGGDTYRHRRRIVGLARADGGFARWHKSSQTWRAKVTQESITALRALQLSVEVITPIVEDDACTTSPTSL